MAYLWKDIASLTLEVVRVSADAHWDAYHAIRRQVLFEDRGLTGYDEHHPDDHRDGHFPFLLLQGNLPVGAARLDLKANSKGVVRTVAIKAAFQRKGLGRVLMKRLEAFAAQHGVIGLEVNAAPDAVTFYEKLGWTMINGSKNNPLMIKGLPALDLPDDLGRS
ncbi:GNAT family N-acetyltransferase [Rhizobium sp. WSM1274]|nr:GNAT family N-acetyltransferase [Rhizobium leguminosarum bv. viciae]